MSQSLEVKKYDVIILGTGFVEAILAGALARIGKSVLHLDANDYYGGGWSAFNFRELLAWVQKIQGFLDKPSENVQETIEGLQLLTTNVPKAICQTYSSLEYEIFNTKEEEIKEINPYLVNDLTNEIKSDSATQQNQRTVLGETNQTTNSLDYETLANYLVTEKKYDQSEPIAEIINGHYNSKILRRTREHEEAIAIESARLTQILQLHKGRNISKETIQNISQSLLSFQQIETLAQLLKESKRYNLELTPKLMSCRGELVELLISSGVARYLDFRALGNTFIYLGEEEFEKVPCSKEDVFTNQTISLVDKRKLMKFLNFAQNYTNFPEIYHGYESKFFNEFLVEKFGIQGKLLLVVLYAIALVQSRGDDVKTLEGLSKTQSYLSSLGRYGNNAFLVAFYGGSEIIQGFCRVSAVYGGIYMLATSVINILIDDDCKKFAGLIDSKKRQLSSNYLVSSLDYLPSHFLAPQDTWEQVSRAIIIIDKSLHGNDEATLTIYPPDMVENRYPIHILQLTPGTQSCPENRRILYISTKASGSSAKQDLIYALEKLINISTNIHRGSSGSSKPNPVFALYYRTYARVATPSLPENIIPVSDPDLALDFESATLEARKLFQRMYIDEEFLTSRPDLDELNEFDLN
ncbi:hypothetical protein G9A89_022513 [Geosiphon pyriformis]|nr:hypothetical protein G9A89_022513 [Geosiphon pyriformis]